MMLHAQCSLELFAVQCLKNQASKLKHPSMQLGCMMLVQELRPIKLHLHLYVGMAMSLLL